MIITGSFVFIDGKFRENIFLHFNEQQILTDISEHPPVSSEEVIFFEGTIVPGWVNVHCHLELSHLKGTIPRNIPMADFARNVIANRLDEYQRIETEIRNAIRHAIETGTVLIGDISNDTQVLKIKSEYENQLTVHTFWELFGLKNETALKTWTEFREKIAPHYQHNCSPTLHAPYSVLSDLIREVVNYCSEHKALLSVHMLESENETELFQSRTGPFADFFRSMGFNPEYGFGHPLEYLLNYFPSDLKVLYVHMTEADGEDLERIRAVTPDYAVCLCPRSNLYIHNKLPNLNLFDPARLCIGTDSLASNDDLNMFKELTCLSQAFPDYSTEHLLEAATRIPAQILGYGQQFGQFKRGFRPGAVGIHHFYPNLSKLRLTSDTTQLI